MMYYVMIMPSGHMIARHEHADMQADEADALDCWYIKAAHEQAAIAKVVMIMYTQYRWNAR